MLETHLGRIETYPAGKDLDLAHAPPMFLLSGWACLARFAPRRQTADHRLPACRGWDRLRPPDPAAARDRAADADAAEGAPCLCPAWS
ncbi:hypothetical protein ACRAWD_26565 [Caulobacter segnis]